MLGRFVCALGASLFFAAACGGGAFTSAADEGSGGSATGVGGKSSGGKGSGGNKAQAGELGQGGTDLRAGSSNGGGVTVAGMSSGGGVNPGGGAVGVSGSGMTGEAGALVEAPECFEPSDCTASNSCHEPVCEQGKCDEVHAPDGPFKLQVAGDCKRMDCVGGEEKLVADLLDKDDHNECTIDSCSQNGIPTHTPRFGEVCANGGGTCNAQGNCVLCNRDACQASTNPCVVPLCVNGTCQPTPRPAGGTFLCPFTSNNPIDPSDTAGQCDGAGNCVDCVTSGACGECCVCSLDRKCIGT